MQRTAGKKSSVYFSHFEIEDALFHFENIYIKLTTRYSIFSPFELFDIHGDSWIAGRAPHERLRLKTTLRIYIRVRIVPLKSRKNT